MSKKPLESILLRDYTPVDLDEIITLFRNTVHHINIEDYSKEQVEAWAPSDIDIVRWKSSLEEYYTLVAESVRGEILGFGNLSDEGYLDLLFVHMDYQACGIASKILRGLEKRALSMGLEEIYTEASISARPFFESRKFTCEREQSKLCRGIKLTNFVMRKRLP